MIKYLKFLAILLFLSSCDKGNDLELERFNTELNTDSFPQKWQLTEMTGQTPNSATSGKNMAWQEYYIFYSDNTFIKSREQNGGTKEAKGTFTIETHSDESYLKLDYDSENSLIGNCTSDLVETLHLNSRNKLQSSWRACDGPGLFYKRVE